MTELGGGGALVQVDPTYVSASEEEDLACIGRLGEPPEQLVDATQADMDELQVLVAQCNVKKCLAGCGKHKQRSWEATQHARAGKKIKTLEAGLVRAEASSDALGGTMRILGMLGLAVKSGVPGIDPRGRRRTQADLRLRGWIAPFFRFNRPSK